MADVLSGTGSAIRMEASVTGYNAAARQWTVHYKATFFERTSSPATFGSAVWTVGGSPGVLGSAVFGFDWTPGGLQAVVVAENDVIVTGDSAGNAPAGWHIDLQIGDTGTSGGGTGGTAQEFVTFSPNPLKVLPNTPTAVSAVRNSDTQATVSWTQTNASNGAPTSHKVRKKINAGAFDAGTTISPASSVALGVAANQKLVFGVQAINASGSTAWSADTTAIYTTPAAPTGLTATKVGSDIVIAWTPNVAFTEHEHQIEHGVDVASVITWDGSILATKASGTSTHTHTAPNPAQRHVYRVRARNTDVTALTSAWVQSNVVQLLAAPAKPSVASPAPFQDKAATFRFNWTHNPIDSSAQTKRQTRYSTNGGSSWTTSSKTVSTDQFLDYAASTFTANQQVLFQVRSKGAYDSGSDGDASYSPWSDSVTVTFKTKPTVTITAPANSSTYTEATLNVVLGFSQPESATFVAATIGLYSGATLLEEIVSTTLAGTTFITRLADGGSYSVKATVTDSNGLVSSQVTSSFTVDYVEPVAAVVTLTYLPDPGWVQIDLVIPAAGGGLVAATAVTITRTIDGVTETITFQYPSAPTLTILDTTPTIAGLNSYEITTYSIDGATSVVTDDLLTTEGEWAFLSTGGGFPTVVRFRSNLELASAPSRESALIRTAGRTSPRALFGVGKGLEVSGTATLFEDGPDSTPQEMEAFILTAGIVCFRDPTGRRMFGVLSGALANPSSMMSSFSFSVTETA